MREERVSGNGQNQAAGPSGATAVRPPEQTGPTSRQMKNGGGIVGREQVDGVVNYSLPAS